MQRTLTRLVGGLGLAALILVLVFTWGMRTKSPVVLNTIRKTNRAVFNPRQRDAGRPGAYASLIHHSGRTTGASYDTPVVAAATEDGFVIALPYGGHADWLKNVLANGTATITHEGSTHQVSQPEVLPIETADRYFSTQDQRAHRLFGTTDCLRLRRVEVGDPGGRAGQRS